jgi:hypothetical protein
MTRAVRVWAAEDEPRRDWVRRTADQWGFADLIAALDADLADHDRLKATPTAPPRQDALIPASEAGPCLPATSSQCACGREVTTELYPWVGADGTVTWLGPGCWRDRALRRADERAGDQLEVFRIPPKEA